MPNELAELLEAPRQADSPYDYPFHVGEYDVRLRDRVREKMPTWQSLSQKREPEFKEFDKFMSSTFFSLYKHTNIAVEPLTESAQSMADILEIARSMPEWRSLQARTKGNSTMAAISSVVIGEHIKFPEPKPGDGDGEGDGEGDGTSSSSPDGTGGDSNGDQEPSDVASDPEVRDAVGKALKEASDACDSADALMELWGNEAGDDTSKDPETLLAMTRMLNDSERLKMISRMLGRLKNQLYRSQMERSNYIPEEFVDVELGNNLPDLLPSARILMAEPELEVVFLLKYVQRALLQQVREGNTPKDQGPIVVLIDVSGSMSAMLGDVPGVGRISRLDWALAVGLVLTILARKQNREYYIAVFDTYIRREIKSSDGPVAAQDLVDMMSVNTMGGTNFERPLRKALDIMLESEYDKADMVFVTDGACYLPEPFIKEFTIQKQERGFRVLGVGCASINPESLNTFCDRSISASSVMSADEASHQIFSIGE